MAKAKIEWNKNGWTCVQEADAEKHKLEIMCRAEDGVVVQVIIRHNDGEETEGKVLKNGENALPIALADFRKLFTKGQFEIR